MNKEILEKMEITDNNAQQAILYAAEQAYVGNIVTPSGIAAAAEQNHQRQRHSECTSQALTQDHSGATLGINLEVQSVGYKINNDLLLKCSTNLQRKAEKLKKKGQIGFLKTISHLSLQDQKLAIIDDGSLDICKALQVLYLFDNRIQKIGAAFVNLTKLTELSLYNNLITKMEGFETLENLERLYLERNRIQKLEGVQHCRKLRELVLSNQQHQSDEFTFDEYSLAGISNSLVFLDLSFCKVK